MVAMSSMLKTTLRSKSIDGHIQLQNQSFSSLTFAGSPLILRIENGEDGAQGRSFG
jgi:hypothetical protein